MPWIDATAPPAETPARYEIPRMVAACNFTEGDLDKAKDKRKHFVHVREEMLALQKSDRETAKFFKDEANDALKWQRAWQFVVDFIEGKPNMFNWRAPGVSKEIAPFLDQAFGKMLD